MSDRAEHFQAAAIPRILSILDERPAYRLLVVVPRECSIADTLGKAVLQLDQRVAIVRDRSLRLRTAPKTRDDSLVLAHVGHTLNSYRFDAVLARTTEQQVHLAWWNHVRSRLVHPHTTLTLELP